MSAKTKIFVFKFRELVYTAIFLGLAILLIVLLVLMFGPKKDKAKTTPETQTGEAAYIPGVYSSSLQLSDQTLNLIVCVDEKHINSIALENLEETVETLYPLVPSTLQSLSSQILTSQSLEDVTFSTANQYTSQLLLSAITQTLSKAALSAP